MEINHGNAVKQYLKKTAPTGDMINITFRVKIQPPPLCSHILHCEDRKIFIFLNGSKLYNLKLYIKIATIDIGNKFFWI